MESMTRQEIIERFNLNRQPVMDTLNGTVTDVDVVAGQLAMRFLATREMCHSVEGHPKGGIVQGGFVAGFLDSAMAHACVARSHFTVVVPSLELKVSFLTQVNPGPVRAEARIRRWGRSIVFLEADLFDDDGTLLATASSTAKLAPMRSAAAA
jgi:acyl-CoA thioesterase